MTPQTNAQGAPAWHALGAEEALAEQASAPSGLSSDVAGSRLGEYGPNRLPVPRARGALQRLLLQFNSLLIYVLVGAALVSLLLGHSIDAAVILAVVILNGVIGFVQEGRAERALEAIRGMIDPRASVLRDGRRLTVPADEIVPGDIALLEAGDRVPGDMRLIRVHSLKIDEAILTGESVAVEKGLAPVAQAAPLGDRTSMAFSGTFVAAGQGAGVVVATGGDTELGRISSLLGAVENLRTPLLRQMDRFARQLTIIILAVSAAAFLFAWLVRSYAFADAFMAVVGLAVAAIPEGLPAIMTITLAIGVQRMAMRNAVIRRLPAVDTLGSVSVICSDKTGTLTRNEMTATTVVTAEDELAVTGTGYGPAGSFQIADREVDPKEDGVLTELAGAAVLCNDAETRETEPGWIVDGDPMEGALVALGMKAGLQPESMRKQLPRIDEIPFDARHRFMATLHHRHDGGAFILIKGAPEQVLEMCGQERHADGDHRLEPAVWRARAEELAGRGQRVLGLATKTAADGKRDLTFSDVEGGAVLLGLVGFIDPPRPEATEAVAECRAAGIRVVMITGDHAATAREIARQLGISERPSVLTGSELQAMDDAELQAAIRQTSVFARTTPEDKLRLVTALQAEGLTVAMTGDGVNDAPALKRADVGVAMGRKGTEAAKEAAEMVLADDNFASIVAAVREGRTVYDNLIKVIRWTLPTNGGEALTILAALAFGLTLPITPVQILWVNMITAVALGLTLAFEPGEAGTMRRRPRPANQPILTGNLVFRIVFVSVLMVAGAFGMFFWAEGRGLPLEEARTLVVNTIVVMEIFYLFSVRYVHGMALSWRGVFGTPAVLIGVGVVVVAQIAVTYLPVLQAVFDTRPIALLDGLAVIAVGVILLVVVEAEKWARLTFASRLRPAGN